MFAWQKFLVCFFLITWVIFSSAVPHMYERYWYLLVGAVTVALILNREAVSNTLQYPNIWDSEDSIFFITGLLVAPIPTMAFFSNIPWSISFLVILWLAPELCVIYFAFERGYYYHNYLLLGIYIVYCIPVLRKRYVARNRKDPALQIATAEMNHDTFITNVQAQEPRDPLFIQMVDSVLLPISQLTATLLVLLQTCTSQLLTGTLATDSLQVHVHDVEDNSVSL